MKLNTYEIEVLRIMLKPEFSGTDLESFISTSVLTDIDFTGAGYLLKITNDLLPIERKVISEPKLIA